MTRDLKICQLNEQVKNECPLLLFTNILKISSGRQLFPSAIEKVYFRDSPFSKIIKHLFASDVFMFTQIDDIW